MFNKDKDCLLNFKSYVQQVLKVCETCVSITELCLNIVFSKVHTMNSNNRCLRES